MTASGERFDKTQLTAAHARCRSTTRGRVTNENNGRTVTCGSGNDRGPYGGHGRMIDLSEAAARVLQMIDAGVVPCQVEVIGGGDDRPMTASIELDNSTSATPRRCGRCATCRRRSTAR